MVMNNKKRETSQRKTSYPCEAYRSDKHYEKKKLIEGIAMVMNNNGIKRVTKLCSCQNLDETGLNLDHIGNQQHLPLVFYSSELETHLIHTI